jgi:hypothetical protein
MKLKHVFWIQVVISTVNGLSSIFMPKTWLSMYGAPEVSPMTAASSQALGAALLTYAIVAFLARDSGPSDARRAIVIGFCITHLIGGIIVALAIISGVMGAMGWGAVFLYWLMAVLYGYFWLIKKE